MFKTTILFISIAAFSFGCGNSDSSKNDSSTEGASATPAKTEEMLLVDKELNLISLNVHDSYEYCKSKEEIGSLDKLVSTEQGRAYVKKKQDESMEILKRHLDEVTENEAQMYINDQEIHNAAFNQAWSANRGREIVHTQPEKPIVSNKAGIYTKSITYTYTIKESGGLFSSDKHFSQRGRGTAKYVLRCKGDENPVSYTGQLLK